MKTADAHYRPFMREHTYVKDVASGKKDLTIHMEKIAELVQGDAPEDIAQEIYAADISAQGIYQDLVNIHQPEMFEGNWVIRKSLTEQGEQMRDALETGVLWNVSQKAPDYVASCAWYQDMMDKGSVESKYAELIGENKREEMRELRNKLVYFRLQGDRSSDGNHIRKISDV
jgi:hypothetical protein